jgi:hypothetical protein
MTAIKLWAKVWRVDETSVYVHVFASRPRHPDQQCGRLIFDRETWAQGVGALFMAGLPTLDPEHLLPVAA